MKELSNKEIERFEIIMKNFIFTSFASMQRSQLNESAFNMSAIEKPHGRPSKNVDTVESIRTQSVESTDSNGGGPVGS